MKTIWLPYCGEFGTKLRDQVAFVHADKSDKIVCCEAGDEYLFPDVERFVIPRIENDSLRGYNGNGKDEEIFKRIKEHFGKDYEYITPLQLRRENRPREFFVPKCQKNYDFETDVMIFPRGRQLRSSQLNWSYWEILVKDLREKNISIFVGGLRENSKDIGCLSAWDFDNPTDATIWGIQHSKIRIVTASGGSWLSLLCGKSVLIIIYSEDWFKPCIPDYQILDHLKVRWQTINSWNNYKPVLEKIIQELKEYNGIS